jgi:hypothetical protein
LEIWQLKHPQDTQISEFVFWKENILLQIIIIFGQNFKKEKKS